jgi:hypothetical protein
MQEQFMNQPVVNWAKQNLPQLIEIKQRFASRATRILVYALLFSIPVLIVAGMVFLKLSGGTEAKWWGVFLCGGVLMIPPAVIILLGALTRQKLVKSLDADGVKSSMGRRFLWKNLYYVDHVSKHSRVGGVRRVVKDNQLELVFADGKAIIPPLIENREQIWNLINSMPAQNKDDGVVREAKPAVNSPAAPSFDEIVKAMGELKAQHDQNK